MRHGVPLRMKMDTNTSAMLSSSFTDDTDLLFVFISVIRVQFWDEDLPDSSDLITFIRKIRVNSVLFTAQTWSDLEKRPFSHPTHNQFAANFCRKRYN